MNVLDIFSGIGAFALGLERAGMRVVAFCECDAYCRAVLRSHWPHAPIFDDVRSLRATDLAWSRIDCIAGGFPCQDISVAGNGAGIEGADSRLWAEFARLLGELRPRYALVENSAALLGRGLSTVLADLAALRYDAEWHCIPASDVGAPHIRDRCWIIAHSNADGGRREGLGQQEHASEQGAPGGESHRLRAPGRWHRSVPDAGGTRLPLTERAALLDARRWTEGRAIAERGWWATEPAVGRVVDGPATRVDRRRRLIALGNALVPQIPEIIGRAIMRAEGLSQ